MSAARTLARLTKLCLALPEATCTNGGRHASFRVRKNVFAYFLDDHHGDGITSLCWKAALGENEELAAAAPKRFYVPAYMGRGRRARARELLHRGARAARRAGRE